MRRHSLPVLGLLLLGGAQVFAQQPSGPPPVLRVTREQFKPGQMAAHNKQIPAFYAFFEKAKVVSPRLGLLPLAGDENHLLYLQGFPSFAEMEAADKKQDEVMAGSPALRAEFDALTAKNDPLHESQSDILATLRLDLSYRPNTMERTGRARYFNVTVTRLNVGRATDYVEYVKQTNAAREKANIDEHTVVFQVVSGAPTGTYLTLATSRSLSEIDDAVKGAAARTQKLNEALGGDAVVKARQKAISEIVAQSVSTLYAIDRTLSLPRPEFVAADPEFWKPKEAAKPAAKK